MKILLVIFAIAVSGLSANAQTHIQQINLVDTTWKVDYDFCGGNNWTEHTKITFSEGGKIKDSNGRWKLIGNKLTVTGATDLDMNEMHVTVRDNQMTGTAVLGMSNAKQFCVRATRQGNTPAKTSSENWNDFWVAFRTAVNTRDRAALKKLMGTNFLWPGEGSVSPDVWLTAMDGQNVWKQVWQELRNSVEQGTKPYKDTGRNPRPARITNDNHLLFQTSSDGRWRWIGFLGD